MDATGTLHREVHHSAPEPGRSGNAKRLTLLANVLSETSQSPPSCRIGSENFTNTKSRRTSCW